MDYTQFKTTRAEPNASSMIETFRAIGYSPETAVADIIDNSITAGAKNIFISSVWKGSKTTFSILDDGKGMNNDELINALRPGSKNPLDKREENDLGRFGLGLKTASFSQSRKFSVFSKSKEYASCFWSWDLDFVASCGTWDLLKFAPDEQYWQDKLNDLVSGTVVLWWDLDRLIGVNISEDDERSKTKFLKSLNTIKFHLSMVFHQFIDEGVNIIFNGRKIKSWNPYMIGMDGLQTKPEVYLNGGKIRLKGFILPHRSKLDPDEYKTGKGPKDSWTEHQGFYVYRNKRLLVAGDWLGFFKKEIHYDLCRIKIDLPNDLDSEWKIDIKKSMASPPNKYREEILSIAKEARNQAVEVYRHKGKVIRRNLAQETYHQLWQERIRHGKRFYKINRNHPIIKELLSFPNKKELEHSLQFIEETVPVPLISLQESESDKVHGKPFENKNHEVVKRLMQQMYDNLIISGRNHDQACVSILSIEPFDSFPEYLEFLNQK